MFENKNYLCSGCHLCFELIIFYVPDAIYALGSSAQAAASWGGESAGDQITRSPFADDILFSGCHLCFEITIFYGLDANYILKQTFSMFRMPFMFENKHFLCSGCHLCFRIHIFYVLHAIYNFK